MKKKNIIFIVNRQTINSEKDTIQLTALGTYIKKNSKGYIIYEEFKEQSLHDNTDISIIKIENPNLVTIDKIGMYKSRLILEKSKRHYCRYNTEYGNINVGIYTNYIKCNLNESTAEIFIKYTMDIQSSITSVNEIYINVKEINKNVKHIDNANWKC